MPRRFTTASILVLLISFLSSSPLSGAPPRDLMSDTWVAVDGLGRELSGHADCGPPREGKQVGIFYFLWLGQHSTTGPWDISELLAKNPEDPEYGPPAAFHHWAEPEWGYYVSNDPYVIRKHAQALSDAGVDVLFFDVTNGFTYDKVLMKLCETLRAMRAEGNSTPQIAFLTNSRSERVVRHLYDAFYAKGLYRELWYSWDGRPLILSKADGLSPEIVRFFTFRQSWAWSRPNGWFGDGKDKWPWVDHYPQKPGWHIRGVPEQTPVAVAQHPVSNIGRSFHQGRQPPPHEEQTGRGLCFAEQWRGALALDPQMVFLTGWNEWVAQRFIAKRPQPFLGGVAQPGETYFVDQYDQEFSRDIEPMRGGHGDNYYWQMVDGIRRFKGVRPLPAASPPKTIAIDGRFDDWDDVGPDYLDTIGDTAHRDHPGWNESLHYKDLSGRNDFVRLKVAADQESVYFLAETREPITECADPHWMLLYIDVDRDHSTGWHGYDFVVNRSVQDASNSSVDALEIDGTARRVAGAPMAYRDKRLELAISRAALGLPVGGGVALNFHWADNADPAEGIQAFARRGDSAPNRRFNYAFERQN